MLEPIYLGTFSKNQLMDVEHAKGKIMIKSIQRQTNFAVMKMIW